MSNGSTESQGSTPPADSPVDIHDLRAREAIEEAKKKAEELAKDLADVVLQHEAPPGTPSLRRR